MNRSRVRVTVKMNRLPAMRKAIPELQDAMVRSVGFAVEGASKQQIRAMGAIDTGALLNSGYTATSRESRRDGAVSAALGRNSAVLFADPTGTIRRGQAIVAFAVQYGIYVHQGTDYMRSRPFLTEGLAVVRPQSPRIAEAVAKNWVESF